MTTGVAPNRHPPQEVDEKHSLNHYQSLCLQNSASKESTHIFIGEQPISVPHNIFFEPSNQPTRINSGHSSASAHPQLHHGNTNLDQLSFAEVVKGHTKVSKHHLLPPTSMLTPTADSEGIIGETITLKPISVYQGKPSIRFLKSEKQKLINNLRYVLVGKFSHGRPSLFTVKGFFANLKLKGELNISIYDSRHLILECVLVEDYVMIWLKLIWIIGGFPMRIFKWTEDFNPLRESVIAPVWISLPRLPLYLFEDDALTSIANVVGKPLKIDMANLRRKNLGCASICVELDISATTIDEVWIEFVEEGMESGEGFWQKIVYNCLPSYCSNCYHIGHNNKECKRQHGNHLNKPGQQEEGDTQGPFTENLIIEGVKLQTEKGTRSQVGRVEDRVVIKACKETNYNLTKNTTQQKDSLVCNLPEPGADLANIFRKSKGQQDDSLPCNLQVGCISSSPVMLMIEDRKEQDYLSTLLGDNSLLGAKKMNAGEVEVPAAPVSGVHRSNDAQALERQEVLEGKVEQQPAPACTECCTDLLLVEDMEAVAQPDADCGEHTAGGSTADGEHVVGEFSADTESVLRVAMTDAAIEQVEQVGGCVKGIKQIDGMLIKTLVEAAKIEVGQDFDKTEVDSLEDGQLLEEPPLDTLAEGQIIEEFQEGNMDVDQDNVGEQPPWETADRERGKMKQLSVTPRKLSSAAAEFIPKSAVCIRNEATLYNDKKEEAKGTTLREVGVEDEHEWEEGLWESLCKINKEKKRAKKEKKKEIKKKSEGKKFALNQTSAKDGFVPNGESFLKDEMCDIIPAFKTNSVPNSPSSRKCSLFSIEYSPTSKTVLAKYGSDSSPFFGCRWEEY